MHVTVDDVNFCDGLECVYVKYKSHVLTALIHGFLPFKIWLLIACDTAFYAIISIKISCSGLTFDNFWWLAISLEMSIVA